MSAKELEKRIEALEHEVQELKRQLKKESDEKAPWYIKNAGMFKDDPVFDEIVERGRQYRESLRPKSRNRKSTKSE
jgi:hypothetical protein